MGRRISGYALISAVATVAFLLCSAGHGTAAAKPIKHTSTIEGTQFQPNVISVTRGDSIVWTNKDPFPHTVTSRSGGFDSEPIQPGESWTFRPSKAGEFEYLCTLHPTMKGVLRVK